MSEIRKRVAQAILLAADSIPHLYVGEQPDLTSILLDGDVDFMALAHAALTSIAEPTPTMLAAGNAVFHNGTAVSALSVWQAMIDEMLK